METTPHTTTTEPRCECGGPLDRFSNCGYATDALARLVPVRNGRQQANSWRVHGRDSRAVAS